MCRIAILPPQTTRREAIKILENMLGRNEDGTGEVYLKDGKFVINKYPYSFEKVLKKNRKFLNHLPHDGVTMVHLRASSVGENTKNNTHPFIIGEGKNQFALIHNGHFHGHSIARLALSKFVKFQGQCDSEVAGNLIDIIGVRKFTDEIDMAGVFAMLHLDGKVTVIKTSGELTFVKRNRSMLMASEFDFKKYPKQLEALTGYFYFDSRLRYISHKEKKSHFVWTKSPQVEEDDGFYNFTGHKHNAPPYEYWDPKQMRYVKKERQLNFHEAGLHGGHYTGME